MARMRTSHAITLLSSILAWSLLSGLTPLRAVVSGSVCHFETTMTTDSEFWAAKSTAGSAYSDGPGTIRCLGALDGGPLAAASGEFTWRVRFSGSCIAGSSRGSWDLSLPMADGTRKLLTGALNGEWRGLTYIGNGRLASHEATVLGETRSDPRHPDEDCTTKPIRHWIDNGQILLR